MTYFAGKESASVGVSIFKTLNLSDEGNIKPGIITLP